MKEKHIYGLIGLIIGGIIVALCILCFKGHMDFSINIIDLVMSLATIYLSIAVVYLSKSLDKKDIIRDLVVTDIEELCSIYQNNSEVIAKLEAKTIELKDAREEINMNFHKGDLVIDLITAEIKESFPKFNKSNVDILVRLTTGYYKWLTGGNLMNQKNFTVDLNFQKEHETVLRNTIKSLKLLKHQLVKSV